MVAHVWINANDTEVVTCAGRALADVPVGVVVPAHGVLPRKHAYRLPKFLEFQFRIIFAGVL